MVDNLIGSDFKTFSVQHFVMLAFLFVMAIYLIRTGRRLPTQKRLSLAIWISGLTLSSEIMDTLVLSRQGRYDYHTDLPLFLCDLSVILLPFVLIRQNRKWIGILYFWTMAGTFQALITPDLREGFPAFEFFRYFVMHGGIVIAVLYTIIVFQVRIHWRDLINAVVYAQVYLAGIHVINQILQSNYSYTMQKPAGPTVLDYFGPWPWYILWGEILMVVLFLLLLFPFMLFKRVWQNQEEETFGTL